MEHARCRVVALRHRAAPYRLWMGLCGRSAIHPQSPTQVSNFIEASTPIAPGQGSLLYDAPFYICLDA